MIEIRNVQKSFGQKNVLTNLNLTIPDGAIFGLVGINGAGKSTLLRIMSGVFKADEGQVLYDGEDVFENEKVKKGIFFLPDDPYYNVNINGEELKRLYSSLYNFDNQIFLNCLGAFKLNHRLDVKNMSKGMRRQLYVALALACQPKYLLLDEAFDGLDPLARLEFKRELIALTEKVGTTVIISSHSLRELEDICESFGLIDNGGIANSGNIVGEVDKLSKFQVAFETLVTKEQLGINCLSFSVLGRVVSFVTREDKEIVRKKLEKLHPLIIDEVPVNFEDLFIEEVKSRGYLN